MWRYGPRNLVIEEAQTAVMPATKINAPLVCCANSEGGGLRPLVATSKKIGRSSEQALFGSLVGRETIELPCGGVREVTGEVQEVIAR
jgi:hypothetical protein